MSGLSDGLGSCNRVRKKSPLFLLIKGWNWTSRTIDMTSMLVHCCLGHESTSKNFPSLFSSTLYHHLETKRLRVGSHTLRAKSRPFTIKVWKPLKVKLRKEWAKIPQKGFRDSCKAFSKRLQLVIDTDGGHIEWYFGNCLSKPYST